MTSQTSQTSKSSKKRTIRVALPSKKRHKASRKASKKRRKASRKASKKRRTASRKASKKRRTAASKKLHATRRQELYVQDLKQRYRSLKGRTARGSRANDPQWLLGKIHEMVSHNDPPKPLGQENDTHSQDGDSDESSEKDENCESSDKDENSDSTEKDENSDSTEKDENSESTEKDENSDSSDKDENSDSSDKDENSENDQNTDDDTETDDDSQPPGNFSSLLEQSLANNRLFLRRAQQQFNLSQSLLLSYKKNVHTLQDECRALKLRIRNIGAAHKSIATALNHNTDLQPLP